MLSSLRSVSRSETLVAVSWRSLRRDSVILSCSTSFALLLTSDSSLVLAVESWELSCCSDFSLARVRLLIYDSSLWIFMISYLSVWISFLCFTCSSRWRVLSISTSLTLFSSLYFMWLNWLACWNSSFYLLSFSKSWALVRVSSSEDIWALLFVIRSSSSKTRIFWVSSAVA